MHVERKRIFVGNLPPCVTEKDIKQQFSKYGNVTTIEIKERKGNSNETVSPVFAFVSIETDNYQLQKCFEYISNYNWKGYYVKLELAKESFLERLKREREEAQSVSVKNESKIKQEDSTCHVPVTYPRHKIIYHNTSSELEDEFEQTKNGQSESSSSSSDSENEIKQSNNKQKEDGVDLIIKNNKNKILTNGKIKIESINATPIHIIPPKQSGLQRKCQQITPADEKRLKALSEMKQVYRQQKSLISHALSNIDLKTKKRNYSFQDETSTSRKKGKLSLFPDDGDEDEVNFEIKEQFEGTKGQKLLQLQSRYTNDTRFNLDSRFLDEENEPVEGDDDEKQKQFDILEGIIGKKIRTRPENIEVKNSMPMGMLRFDPSKPEHSKFEIEKKSTSFIEKQKEIREKVTEHEEKLEEPVVNVSKEKFYKVTDNLKESLKGNKEFSLLNMFGTAKEKDDENEDIQETEQELKKNKFGTSINPFKYDSSDTEEEEVSVNTRKTLPKNQNQAQPFGVENFFFGTNDERFQEGLDFLQRFNQEKLQNFEERRSEFKQIIRLKLRNVQRDNRQFRKKITNHKKIIKIKKQRKQ